MAGLSRVLDARHDHAAPALRLLLADAHAGARDRIRRQRGTDRLSHQEGRGRRDFRPRPQALVGGHAMQKILLAILLAGVGASAAAAQEKVKVDPARGDAGVRAASPPAPADWQPRLVPDETMRLCSAHNNSPPAAISEQIQAREKARIEYPADGKLVGDWKAGEKLGQSGYGLRVTDSP